MLAAVEPIAPANTARIEEEELPSRLPPSHSSSDNSLAETSPVEERTPAGMEATKDGLA